MGLRIEDYALIGDTRTAALVGRDGSIDWLCLPRFDSGACFAALLGSREHGRWQIAPVGDVRSTRRRYREGTLVLETEFTTDTGVVRIVDAMPPDEATPNLVRQVECVSGQVTMRMDLVIRFDYGWIVPWVRKADGALLAVGGPDALELQAPVALRGEGLATVADFTMTAGDRVPFALSWYPSHEAPPPPIDVPAEIARAEAWWRAWSARCVYQGPWREAVVGSLITLKALTYRPTGGIVAAPTTSLPEAIGGVRNWDYRYCWLRDATFTLYALRLGGYEEEAHAWRDWLLRAAAGSPDQLHVLYGVAGERRLPELTLPWLPGYEGSAPVRIGNDAATQLQLDIYGEVIDALFQGRKLGIAPDATAWAVQRRMLEFLEGAWQQPDEGIWEVRGPRQHFTHSKIMTWVAFDRAVKTVEASQIDGPVDRWRAIRDAIHADVCAKGFDTTQDAFTQAYGSSTLDASLLLTALVGFLPASDPRIGGTVRAIERELLQDGLVMRYRSDITDDGLPPGEGAFLACSFWLADNYALLGRRDDALALFEHLLSLRNDVGLLAEEYDPVARRLLGNFPQAFSHVGLVNTACNLTPQQVGPADERKKR
ncbi:MAG: glycoside hydrolase family 15 protein [Deltaproteobacteria bacterium]|nr:glycoside hydrolase family 15 protein [Deltaproteobacteria bacterium]MDQ3297658.1 glycoside hydrolase family 15 protein [Myxococcota bacterium]